MAILPITTPTHGATGWDTSAVNGVISTVNDLILPAYVTATGNGTNSFTTGTINTWTNLPTTVCTGSFTNPHLTRQLLVHITLSVWLVTSLSAVNIRAGINWTGGITSTPSPGGGILAPPGNGHIPLLGISASTVSFCPSWYALWPANTSATFTVQAQWDSTTGTKQVNYPTVSIQGIAYQ